MKKSILHILLLFFAGSLFAQDAAVLFKQANASYREGNYQEALNKFQTLDSLGKQSADLYYNLGNTYYKLNQIGPSIYYFEKALILNPNHQDAKHNLVFAQRMTIDAFEELPKSIFQKFNEKIIYPINYNTWAWVSVVLAFLISIFFLLYYFASNTLRKRLFFSGTILSGLLFLFSLSFTLKAKHYFTTNQPAIIFSAKAVVKAEPNTQSSEIFELHEGTKVQVLEQIDTWYKIKISDGKIGWVSQESLRKLKS